MVVNIIVSNLISNKEFKVCKYPLKLEVIIFTFSCTSFEAWTVFCFMLVALPGILDGRSPVRHRYWKDTSRRYFRHNAAYNINFFQSIQFKSKLLKRKKGFNDFCNVFWGYTWSTLFLHCLTASFVSSIFCFISLRSKTLEFIVDTVSSSFESSLRNNKLFCVKSSLTEKCSDNIWGSMLNCSLCSKYNRLTSLQISKNNNFYFVL